MPGKHHRALYKTTFCLAFHAFLRIGEMTVQSANATNPNLLQWKQLEIKDTSLTVTFIHFKHSKLKPLTLTIKGTASPQDCPLQIMKAYLSVRGATAGPLFLYCPNVPVTRAKFNEQLRGALQFCHFCPKQFKSHSFRIGAAITTASQGMSDSQIRSLGRWSSDAFMKYIRCSQSTCMIEMFAKTYMLGCLAPAIFQLFQVCKCFSAAECLHATGLEGSQTWTKPHPDQQGWSHNGDHQLTFLFVFINQRYSRFRVQLSHLAFFWGQNIPPVQG